MIYDCGLVLRKAIFSPRETPPYGSPTLSLQTLKDALQKGGGGVSRARRVCEPPRIHTVEDRNLDMLETGEVVEGERGRQLASTDRLRTPYLRTDFEAETRNFRCCGDVEGPESDGRRLIASTPCLCKAGVNPERCSAKGRRRRLAGMNRLRPPCVQVSRLSPQPNRNPKS